LKSGSITDNNIIASSEKIGNPAKNGRLNSGSSWCARASDTNPYLEIDLQTLHIICAVSTQGDSVQDHWVNNYTLQFSKNGSVWSDYKEGGQVKVKGCYNMLYTVEKTKPCFLAYGHGHFI